jgi:hypothetical protein
MPNWCENSVTFTHKDPQQIQRLVAAFNDGRLLNEFFPLPEELRETTIFTPTNDTKRAEQLIEKHGFSNCYDWQVSNWGTKWDVDSNGESAEAAGDATEVTIYFNTAWSPPIGWYQHMEDEQSFSISAFYYEMGMGFCGCYEDGNDDYYEIAGDSAWVEKHIPAGINEAFNISENMSQWEDENDEEETEEDSNNAE